MVTIEVDFGSDRPVYRQIAEQLRGLVARGEVAEGAELPSVRQLAASVGVNLNTVAKAYRILADEGLVDLRHGSRARVRGGASTEAPEIGELVRQLHDVISRLVLHGRSRAEVTAFFDSALESFFER